MNQTQLLLAQLAAHVSSDAIEEQSRTTARTFVAGTAEPFRRTTLKGHVTGSAMVLDHQGRALLLFHARLELWVQPGGHVEQDDVDVAAAALREAREETGLPDLSLDCDDSGRPLLLDIDVHPIPANSRRNEPAHWHHDLCFLARTRSPGNTRIDPDESRSFRWVAAADLGTVPIDVATRRRLIKAFARVGR